MQYVAFRRIQIGRENPRGQQASATRRLMGNLSLAPTIEWFAPTETTGTLAEFRRQTKVGQSAVLRYEGPATYQEITRFLAMSVRGGVSGTGAGSAKTWTFTPSLTSPNNQDSFTFQFGADTQAFISTYVMCSALELSVGFNAPVMLRADLFGRFPITGSFTTGLPNPQVEDIVSNLCKVYIDNTWGNLGTTPVSNLVAGATIRLATGLAPVKYADGTLDFSAVIENKRHLEIELDLVFNSTGLGLYNDWVAGNAKAIRIEFEGSTIAGTDKHRFIIDAYGRFMANPEVFGERSGENIIRLVLFSQEDTSGNEFRFQVVNTETTL